MEKISAFVPVMWMHFAFDPLCQAECGADSGPIFVHLVPSTTLVSTALIDSPTVLPCCSTPHRKGCIERPICTMETNLKPSASMNTDSNEADQAAWWPCSKMA